MLSGSTPWSLATQFPGYCVANLKKMQQFSTWSYAMRENESKLVWPPNLKYRGKKSKSIIFFMPDEGTESKILIGACSVTRRLVEWCSLNIHCKRSFKQKQLYLHGPANTLKTSFVHILLRYCTSYEIPNTRITTTFIRTPSRSYVI